MIRKKHIQWIWAVVAGAILGAVVGDVIGVTIHSDNLPFFDALGVAIGTGIGFMLFLWGSTRSL
jgi:putative Ca2+/H+ antiporter (TMEM165/GDT1 family)